MRKLRWFGLSILLITCCSWGFLVHRTIQQLAIYELPGSLQHYFFRNMDYLVKNSVRPDQRRNSDPSEGPKHFIDLEPYGDSAAWKMPMTWNEAVAKYTRDTLLKYGYVPYQVLMMKEQLTNAFRKGDKDSVLFYATDMAHYIEDANAPLHTTTNYDGQLSNQRGLHNLWESIVPEHELESYQLYSKHKVSYLDHPEQAIWGAVRRAHLLLNDVFEQEKEASRQFNDSTKYVYQTNHGRQTRSYSPAFAKVYGERLGKTVNEQLMHSADLVADFWYTCWVDGGKPDLDSWCNPAFSKQDESKLKNELKAYKDNKLIEQKLLIARQNPTETF
jgi:hypothetical protein